MSILFTRTAVVPVWLLVCLFVVVWSPPSRTVGLLMLTSGLAAVAILLLRKTLPAPVPHKRLNSWPNSGFRNIGRGTKGG
jgi:hypothetical protein